MHKLVSLTVLALFAYQLKSQVDAVGFTQDIMTEGLYEEPTFDEMGNEDEDGEPVRAKSGIFGYQCQTKSCSNEPRPGIPWPSKCSVKSTKLHHYCIPFVVSPEMDKPDRMREVYRAMRWMRDRTCVAFVYRKTEKNYVKFIDGLGCVSESLGASGGEQFIELGPGCYQYPALVFHELMHTTGFEHLHQRWDRNKHLKINLSNIEPALHPMFQLKENIGGSENLTFNYDSVMLYGSIDFQKSDLVGCNDPECWTIMSKSGGRLQPVYQKTYPTDSDFAAINALYACDDPGMYQPNKPEPNANPLKRALRGKGR